MGVPAFFRWVSRKYEKITQPVTEEAPNEVDGQVVPVDLQGPNLNGVEFDNLYLDMNGIIHPCANPREEGIKRPTSEEDIMVSIFKYIDRIFAMVRPRKLVYMAIDGVAPRAKMNQQRARRFQADRARKLEAAETIAQEIEITIENAEDSFKFDTNTITPGTPFMGRLAAYLRYYVVQKMNADPAWKNIKVILSDAGVAGEGEHKIMDYIRRQRAEPTYDPNTSHILYGLDADLIMLALASHEPHFRILREDVVTVQERERKEERENKRRAARGDPPLPKETGPTPFIIVHVNILREYLEAELQVPGRTIDLERAIDDWVFLCFFVGNDFLPHLPALEIREGALVRLVQFWRDHFQHTGQYLTDNGKVDVSVALKILEKIAELESSILKERHVRELEMQARARQREQAANAAVTPQLAPSPVDSNSPDRGPDSIVTDLDKEPEQKESRGIKRKAESTSESIADSPPINGATSPPSTSEVLSEGVSTDQVESKEPTKEEDAVRIHEEGYEGRYYHHKFHVAPDDVQFRQMVCRAYMEGLCWVLHYYYHGCASWSWYYPYHYPPLTGDFKHLGEFSVDFPPSQPIRPLEQLMSVLPAGSRACLPSAFANLMVDPLSDVLDFYPEQFELDLNGKKFDWQAVVLLPFINADRLHAALENVMDTLSEEEQQRNTPGNNSILVGPDSPLYPTLCDLYSKPRDSDKETQLVLKPTERDCTAGFLRHDPECIPHTTYYTPFQELDMPNVKDNMCLSAIFILPDNDPSRRHRTTLLPGVRQPRKILTRRDIDFVEMNKNNLQSGNPQHRGRFGAGHSENWAQYHHRQGHQPSGKDGTPPSYGGGSDRSHTPRYGAQRIHPAHSDYRQRPYHVPHHGDSYHSGSAPRYSPIQRSRLSHPVDSYRPGPHSGRPIASSNYQSHRHHPSGPRPRTGYRPRPTYSGSDRSYRPRPHSGGGGGGYSHPPGYRPRPGRPSSHYQLRPHSARYNGPHEPRDHRSY
ncbi:5'-3' exoribonuclease 2 [Dispira simplex]|nr:5'-3' exoribonuclease 2 [Dispira simplex]